MAEGAVSREVTGGISDAYCVVRTTRLKIYIRMTRYPRPVVRDRPDQMIAEFPVWSRA